MMSSSYSSTLAIILSWLFISQNKKAAKHTNKPNGIQSII